MDVVCGDVDVDVEVVFLGVVVLLAGAVVFESLAAALFVTVAFEDAVWFDALVEVLFGLVVLLFDEELA